MNISRLTISKETQNKIDKPISHFKKGQLRWKKLEELEKGGQLKQAKNRLDIVEMLGYSRGYNACYTWVSHLITRGNIQETLYGLNKDGRMEYEYSIIKSPLFDPADRAKPNKVSKVKTVSVVEKPKPIVTNKITVIDNKAKVIIRYNELTIELEDIDQTTIENLVERLALATKR